MKNKTTFLAAMLCSLFAFMGVQAQNPIATLEHAGTTSVFYGVTAFNDAYNASVNGDELYLSAGYFNAPAAIAKGIKVYGAGHFPDSANIARRTFITGTINIMKGADSLRIEGMYIDGDIGYDGSNSVDYVKVIRCRMRNVSFYSNLAAAGKDYCSYEECFIDGSFNFNKYGTTLSVSKCVIKNDINDINNGALFEKNIFLYTSYYQFSNINASIFRDNIILNNYYILTNCTGNTFTNNIMVMSSPSWGTNTQINNYKGVTQSNIFVNQTGNAIDYTHDYHLKNPETYIGTDNTQVGLYGGEYPFKDKGVASNPAFIVKSVSPNTDANGNLQINFTVKAQER